LVGISLSYKVVDQQTVFVLALEFQLTDVSNRVKRLLLNALEDFVLGLLIVVYSLNHTQCVLFSPLVELFQSAQV